MWRVGGLVNLKEMYDVKICRLLAQDEDEIILRARWGELPSTKLGTIHTVRLDVLYGSLY